MSLLKKTDEEILEIANPLWDELIASSNKKDYNGFTRNFSKEMMLASNEVEIGKQWARNEMLTSLSKDKEFLGCLRRDNYVTVIFKQTSKQTNKQTNTKTSKQTNKHTHTTQTCT